MCLGSFPSLVENDFTKQSKYDYVLYQTSFVYHFVLHIVERFKKYSSDEVCFNQATLDRVCKADFGQASLVHSLYLFRLIVNTVVMAPSTASHGVVEDRFSRTDTPLISLQCLPKWNFCYTLCR